MATRRGAANLDDLKARLGYTDGTGDGDPLASSGLSQATPTSDPLDFSGASAPSDATGPSAPVSPRAAAPAASAPGPAAKSAPDVHEDYSAAVSTADVTAFEFDANAVDPTIKAPTAAPLTGVIVAAVGALAVGAVIGAFAVTSNTTRAYENAATSEAARVQDAVAPLAAMLAALDADLAAIDPAAGFSPQFQEKLRTAYASGHRALDSALLADAKSLLGRTALAPKLVDYAVGTSFLASLVERHLALTERDAEEIARINDAREDATQYGMAVDLEGLLARVQAFNDDPAANPFSPVGAERVTYTELALRVVGTGDTAMQVYTVQNAAGAPIEVKFHDLIVLQKEQILPPISSENALDRYRLRAAQIKEVLAQVTAQQADLLTQLDTVASRPQYFTF